ncbi:hypothetical protein AVEN_92923-1 [Araneus ventricosus]|uniref:Uncharacterized protein n=1 Tax=Araneus ventricosus TaxID=182803 RepID=A0A4Y2D072_ARAVE|nr:hypothetical protein AVEN_92923-1 [Araneus ventricosus]
MTKKQLNWLRIFCNVYALFRKVYICTYIIIHVRNTLMCFELSIAFGLSLVIEVGNISDELPTIVRQRCRGPIPLVPFFHVGNVLMETFAVLINGMPAVIREEIQVGVQKMDL